MFVYRLILGIIFFFSSRRRHTRWPRDWSSEVCSSDLQAGCRTVGLQGGARPCPTAAGARPAPGGTRSAGGESGTAERRQRRVLVLQRAIDDARTGGGVVGSWGFSTG